MLVPSAKLKMYGGYDMRITKSNEKFMYLYVIGRHIKLAKRVEKMRSNKQEKRSGESNVKKECTK